MESTYYYSTDNNATWSTWTTTSASTCDTSSGLTWNHWTYGTGADCSPSTTTAAWTTWTSITQPYSYQEFVSKPIVISPEEVARLNAENQERERLLSIKRAEEKKKRDEAIEKSRQLLVSLLDKAQVEDLEKKGEFGFVSPSGTVYVIKKGWIGNVIREEKDGKRTRLCCHPKTTVPEYDNMVAQLLLLKFDEKGFVDLANKTPMHQ